MQYIRFDVCLGPMIPDDINTGNAEDLFFLLGELMVMNVLLFAAIATKFKERYVAPYYDPSDRYVLSPITDTSARDSGSAFIQSSSTQTGDTGSRYVQSLLTDTRDLGSTFIQSPITQTKESARGHVQIS
jgi:hypothetical protein